MTTPRVLSFIQGKWRLNASKNYHQRGKNCCFLKDAMNEKCFDQICIQVNNAWMDYFVFCLNAKNKYQGNIKCTRFVLIPADPWRTEMTVPRLWGWRSILAVSFWLTSRGTSTPWWTLTSPAPSATSAGPRPPPPGQRKPVKLLNWVSPPDQERMTLHDQQDTCILVK